jgi:hypothetical protein
MSQLEKMNRYLLGLSREQRYSGRYQDDSNPPPLVHAFMQEDFCRDGVADEGEGSGGGCHQAYVPPGEREQQAEEGYGHGRDSKKKPAIAQRSKDDDAKSGATAQSADVPNLPHGTGQKHIADDRSENDGKDSAPSVNALHD